MTSQELKTELITDSKTLGFSDHPNDDDADNQWCADKLNEIGASNETDLRETVNTADIITAIYSKADEFMTLTQLDFLRLNLLSPVGEINPASIQDVVKAIFTAESFSVTRAALIALATIPCSRATALGWPVINQANIHNARIA